MCQKSKAENNVSTRITKLFENDFCYIFRSAILFDKHILNENIVTIYLHRCLYIPLYNRLIYILFICPEKSSARYDTEKSLVLHLTLIIVSVINRA